MRFFLFGVYVGKGWEGKGMVCEVWFAHHDRLRAGTSSVRYAATFPKGEGIMCALPRI